MPRTMRTSAFLLALGLLLASCEAGDGASPDTSSNDASHPGPACDGGACVAPDAGPPVEGVPHIWVIPEALRFEGYVSPADYERASAREEALAA